MSRDPIDAILAFNRPFTEPGRDLSQLTLKLDKLCASPLGFLRGTFHLFVADWAAQRDHDPLPPSDPRVIVGDLHLENFGAYEVIGGNVVFGINDFDDAGPGSAGLDLARLATSIVLADDDQGSIRAVGRVQELTEAWLDAVRSEAPAPDDRRGLPAAIRKIVDKAEDASRSDWLSRRVEEVAGKRRFLRSIAYQVVQGPLRTAISAGVATWAAACPDRPEDCPAWPRVIDVAARTAGTGSLGRLRWAVLLPGRGEKTGKELVIELKEARPSPLAPDADGQADLVLRVQRRMQGASPAYLGTAAVGGRQFTIRELQPTETKVQAENLSPRDLDEVAPALGTALGRAHRRCNPRLADDLSHRDRGVVRRTAAFALRAAEAAAEDHATLTRRRDEVEAALGLGTRPQS